MAMPVLMAVVIAIFGAPAGVALDAARAACGARELNSIRVRRNR